MTNLDLKTQKFDKILPFFSPKTPKTGKLYSQQTKNQINDEF